MSSASSLATQSLPRLCRVWYFASSSSTVTGSGLEGSVIWKRALLGFQWTRWTLRALRACFTSIGT